MDAKKAATCFELKVKVLPCGGSTRLAFLLKNGVPTQAFNQCRNGRERPTPPNHLTPQSPRTTRNFQFSIAVPSRLI